MMRVLHICLGKAKKTPAKLGLTGHFKTTVSDPVNVHTLGLDGDTICDLEHHGGADQAVYLFGDPDRVWFSQQLGRDLPPGHFGENLLVSDLHSANMAIGDIMEIGSVTLEITSPRIPCATYHAHVGTPTAIKDFLDAKRPGIYGRVLQAGQIQTGDPVKLIPYTGDRITMAEDIAQYAAGGKDKTHWQRLLGVPAHHKAIAKARAILNR